MIILNYYRNSSDTLRGFVYDTEKKTYKKFRLVDIDWQDVIQSYEVKPDFKLPCDIDYYFSKAGDLDARFSVIEKLGFIENPNMILDFGCIII
jgi:hypothetical protein